MKKQLNGNNGFNTLEIYKSIIANANDIILLLDSDGNILDANNQAVECYGYSYDELTSMDIFKIRNPDNISLVKKQFAQAKFSGIEFETVHFRKDRSSFPVEVKSIGLDYGSRYYVASIIRDITKRKKREEEIRAFASIVESSQDAILSTTSTGIITSWNKGAEDLFLYLKSEVLGKHASILVPENSKDDINDIILKVKSNERVEHYETTRIRKDGQLLLVSVSVSPMYDFENNFIGVSAIIRDLTEKYNLTKKLSEHEERWRLANELILGNTFQASLMSNSRYFGHVQMWGKYVPSSMVGGDLYDCSVVGDSIWFIVADVAGHGLVAAMLSTMIKGLFNNCIQHCQFPHEVLESMNDVLFKVQTVNDLYLTSAFVGVIRNNTLFFSNAGHPYPVILKSTKNKVMPLEQNGFLLAMFKNASYETLQTSIYSKDVLVFYTDGLFDLKSFSSTTYWERISAHALQNHRLLNHNPSAFIESLIDSFQAEFPGDYEDDVSIMVLKML